MVQKHHIEEVAGGRERTLSEKLPDNFEVKTQTQTKRAPIITPGVHLTGAMEIHRLTVENKLMGREAELTVDLINATCTTDGWTNYKEVIQSPRSLSLHPIPPGNATVARLQLGVLGVGAAAAEQWRRPQPARHMERRWVGDYSTLLGG